MENSGNTIVVEKTLHLKMNSVKMKTSPLYMFILMEKRKKNSRKQGIINTKVIFKVLLLGGEIGV